MSDPCLIQKLVSYTAVSTQPTLCLSAQPVFRHSKAVPKHSFAVSDIKNLCQTLRRLGTEFLKTKQNLKNKTRCIIHGKSLRLFSSQSLKGAVPWLFYQIPRRMRGQAYPKAKPEAQPAITPRAVLKHNPKACVRPLSDTEARVRHSGVDGVELA